MKYAFALAAVAGLAAAQPHAGGAHHNLHKKHQLHARMETVTEWDVVTVTDVVTVYGPSPVSEPTPKVDPPKAVVTAPAASSPPAAPKASQAPPAAPPVVAPSPSVAPVPTSEAPKAQPAPAASSAAAAAPPANPPANPPTGGSGAGKHGLQPGASAPADCTKDAPCKDGMTTYTTGLGACGFDDTTNNDQVVALQLNMFGSVTNTGLNAPSNPLCNKKIQITNPATGATAVGVIRDRCTGCSGDGGIDLSPPLWAKLNNNGPGDRVPVQWYFLD